MTARELKVFLEPDSDYARDVVVCPSLPGCRSQGKTVSEPLMKLREAIELCREVVDSLSQVGA
jgi:predicted RNase H-like HicB family nuclease